MVKNLRKKNRETKNVEKVLLKLFPDHPPRLPPEAYRYNPASIRVFPVSWLK